MLPGMLELVPNARVGHLGLQRDERTAVASQYYAKLPKNIEDSYVLLIDPMLATGGSAVAALDMLTKAGARHLRLVCIVAAPEGVAAVETRVSVRADLHAGGRPGVERAQVHRARTWRLRRSPLRHHLEKAELVL